MKSQNQFRRSLRPFLLSNFYLEIRHLVSLLAPYKVHKPPKNLYPMTWAGTKMSYCYFLFIFSWYVKPKLISEKFEAIFVKHFIPWNLTASKRCSSQIGPETPQKILRGAFSMPKSNSKHTRNWWDSFLLFWLGANSLPRTCDQVPPTTSKVPTFTVKHVPPWFSDFMQPRLQWTYLGIS